MLTNQTIKMAEQTIDKRNLPAELTQLPIFQVIGNQLPAAVKTPEGKKTIASLFFWIALIGGSFAFFKALPTLIQYAQMTVWLIALSIVVIVLIMLYPKIVSLLYNAGRILLFKGEKGLVRKNPIETLELLNIDAKDTLKKVREKIASVDGVRINMIDEAVRAKEEADTKYSQVKSLTAEAARLEKEAGEYEQKGFNEKANAFKRDAKETRVNATLRMEEGKASEHNARQYTQYGNQFARVLEVLKDNESASRIYVNAMGSTISIVSKKLEATSKMTSATQGLAEVFQIKDGWKYQQAMDAATSLISQNIGRIRSNLEFLDENQSITLGASVSQSDLESFVKQIDNGRLETLNIGEMTDSSYELTSEQKPDKGFNILD
jgi:hypothetical protein